MSADIEYGWAKLMSEIQMKSFNKQYGLKGCPVRFVTVYGPREDLTHAIIALIYKAVEKMDPFEIWGDGNQEILHMLRTLFLERSLLQKKFQI